MSEHHHRLDIPRGVLWAAGAMILMSLGLAAGARHAHLAHPEQVARPVESIDLRFQDLPDGAIAVFDADKGREVSRVPPRSNGFIRGVLRGMFRIRKLESLDRQGRFRLARAADGRLSLSDPQTGRRVELDSFGPTNSAAFAQLLAARRQVKP